MKNQLTDLNVDQHIALCSDDKNTTKTLSPFWCCGYFDCKKAGGSSRKYYFYSQSDDAVHSFTANNLTSLNLLELAKIDYWRTHYGTTDKRCKYCVDWDQARLELISACSDIGEFKGAVKSNNNNIKSARYDS